jgi:uncharacterized delta-60 repeat protein
MFFWFDAMQHLIFFVPGRSRLAWLILLLLALLALARPTAAQTSCGGTTVAVSPAGPLTLCAGGSTTLTALATAPGFNVAGTGFNGTVWALAVQPDGKVLVGGDFTSYNGAADAPDRLLRLNADGSLDTSFNYTAGSTTTGLDLTVYALAVQPDGRVLVGGRFDSYNGAADAPNNLLRLLPDGSLDTSFNYTAGSTTTGPDTNVHDLVVQPDGRVLVAGEFTRYNGVGNAPNYVLRLTASGAVDQTFNYPTGGGTTGASDFAYTLALQPDGRVLVGGRFASYNGAGDAPNYVLRLTAAGALDPTFNYTAGSTTTGTSGPVYALALQPDGNVLVGGDFYYYNGDTAAPSFVLRLTASGSLDTSFNNTGGNAAGTDDVVRSLALQPDGRVLVGGWFRGYNGDADAPSHVLRLTATGALDTGFNYSAGNTTTGANNYVYPLALQPDGRVLVGGAFSGYNGSTAAPNNLVRLNANGSLNNAAGPPSGVSYAWLPGGSTGPTLAVTAPGTYRATATVNGCTSYSPEVTVSAAPALTVSTSPAGPLTLCAGGSTTLTALATVPGFNVAGTGFSGPVFAVVVQPDGKVLVGGGFTSYNGDASAPDRLLRLNADGSLDTSFNYTAGSTTTGAGSTVRALLVQPDGRVLVGGDFTAYNGAADAPDKVLRLLADGSLDTSFNYTAGSTATGANSNVRALALQPDGRVLVGGDFQSYNGAADAPNYVLRLLADGSLDTSFNYTAGSTATGASASVYALALQPDGRVLAGGAFTAYNGATDAPNYVLRLTATGALDTDFNYVAGSTTTGANSLVYALALQPDGQVLVGGSFATYNGAADAPNNLLRLTATGDLDQTFNYTAGSTTTGTDGTVYALALQPDGRVLAGGDFFSYNGATDAPDRMLRLTASGALDTSFNYTAGSTVTGANSVVYALALQPDGRVLPGGIFTAYNGMPVLPDYLLRLNANGSPHNAATTPGGLTYAWLPGGSTGATLAVTTPGRYRATATLDGCTSYGPAVTVSAPPAVRVSVNPAGPLTQCAGSPTTLTATAVLPGFNVGGAGFNGAVQAVVVQPDGKVLVGGGFTAYNGATDAPNYVLRLNADGSLDTSFNYTVGSTSTGASGIVYALALQPDGKVLVGGQFTSYNGATDAPNNLVRLNADGSLDTSFNYTAGSTSTGANGIVYALALQPDGQVLVGGAFTAYNGATDAPNYVLRLLASGGLDQTFNYTAGSNTTGTGSLVYALALQPDGQVLVGGGFTAYNGVTDAPDRVLRLNANGGLDQTFNYTAGSTTTGANSTVYALALQPDGKVVVGGTFTTYNTAIDAPDRVLRLSATGELDQSFNYTAGSTTTGLDNQVNALAVQPDGGVLVGGQFGAYNGAPDAPDYVLRLTASGALDTGFNYTMGNTTTGTNANVYALAVQPDGGVLVGGQFGAYNGATAAPDRLLRLNANGSLNDTDQPLLAADGYTFSFSNGSTTTPGNTTSATGAGSYVASVSGPALGSCAAAATPVVVSVPASLSITTTGQSIAAGTYCSISIGSGGSATLAGPVQVLGSLAVANGGTLNLGSFAGPAITGPGTVAVQAGATLRLTDPAGLAPAGTAAGAVQNTGSRSFASGARYAYTGSAAQATGAGLPATVARLTLANAAGLSLSQALTVTEALVLSTGTLSTGAFAVTLGPVATLSESLSPVGRVLGTVQATRNLSTANSSETFGGLGLTLTPRSTGGADLPGATLVRRVTGASLSGAGSSLSIRRYFDIQPATDTNLNVDFSFGYRDDELPAGFLESQLTLFKSESSLSGPWAPQRNGLTRNATANTVTVPGIRSFSLWTLGTDANPLPVELLTFAATAEGPAARLKWTTASEKNSARFEVERSADGEAFGKIGEVAAQGTTARPSRYTFLDATRPAGLAYYRLRQVDQDGTSSYSPVRVVSLGSYGGLTLFPNPAHSALTVAGLTSGAALTVLDALGRPLARATADASGTVQLTLPAGLAPGVYILRSGAQARRLTVE